MTGGIAAYKAVVLLRGLVAAGAEVQVVMTPAATRFVGPDTFAALSRRPVHSDLFERTDVVLHVLLAPQAEVAVVAPATANVLARLALGLADDLLSSTLLEASCPLVVAPAMHTGMWSHPATRANLETLRSRGVAVVDPETGPLAAGDEGVGRMAEPEHVLTAVVRAAGGVVAPPTERRPPAGLGRGRSGLVTAGPTFEPIDAVRYWATGPAGRWASPWPARRPAAEPPSRWSPDPSAWPIRRGSRCCTSRPPTRWPRGPRALRGLRRRGDGRRRGGLQPGRA